MLDLIPLTGRALLVFLSKTRDSLTAANESWYSVVTFLGVVVGAYSAYSSSMRMFWDLTCSTSPMAILTATILVTASFSLEMSKVLFCIPILTSPKI